MQDTENLRIFWRRWDGKRLLFSGIYMERPMHACMQSESSMYMICKADNLPQPPQPIRVSGWAAVGYGRLKIITGGEDICTNYFLSQKII